MKKKIRKKLETKPSTVRVSPVKKDDRVRNAIGRQPSYRLVFEPRIMLDAALAPTVAETVTPAPDAAPTPEASDAQFVEAPAPAAQAPADPSQTDSIEPRKEIIFIDSAVSDYTQLIAGIDPDVEVYILDGGSDGMEQIATALETLQAEENFQGFDAIHIVSHGDEARLFLGNSTLTVNSMERGHADELATIKSSLTENADVLIYGCNFGETEEGKAAAELLRSLTGADIAVSTDDTGHEIFGGDWELEYKAGIIESSVIFSDAVQAEWKNLLEVTSFNYGSTTMLNDPNAYDIEIKSWLTGTTTGTIEFTGSLVENTSGEYTAIATDDTSSWTTIPAGGGKEALSAFEFFIDIDPATIDSITFKWVGQMASGDSTLSMAVLNDGASITSITDYTQIATADTAVGEDQQDGDLNFEFTLTKAAIEAGIGSLTCAVIPVPRDSPPKLSSATTLNALSVPFASCAGVQ